MDTKVSSFISHTRNSGSKLFALLVDPDKADPRIIETGDKGKPDLILVGGSLLTHDHFETCITSIKSLTDVPVVIFPGNSLQISSNADAILLLSLISGRNADLLIGQHVNAVYKLKNSGLEVLPTGYMLMASRKTSTAEYISQTQPIPRSKPEIAAATAMAGEMLGLQQMYLEAGSGANQCVPQLAIKAVRENTRSPLWVGGGIDTPEKAARIAEAGADIVVVGTAIEQNPSLITEFKMAIHSAKSITT